MKEKTSFIVYADCLPKLEMLTMEQRGELFTDLCEYVLHKKKPQGNGVVELMFAFMADNIDREADKFLETCKKKSASGRKGGLKSGETRKEQSSSTSTNEAKQSSASANEAKQSSALTNEAKRSSASKCEANEAETETVSETETETETVSETETETVSETHTASYGSGYISSANASESVFKRAEVRGPRSEDFQATGHSNRATGQQGNRATRKDEIPTSGISLSQDMSDSDLTTHPETTQTSDLRPRTSDPGPQEEFEKLWEMYPHERRQGKKSALAAYERARKKGVTFEKVKKALENYISQIAHERTQPRYIKQASTWFSGEPWQDEYNIGSGDPYKRPYIIQGGIDVSTLPKRGTYV